MISADLIQRKVQSPDERSPILSRALGVLICFTSALVVYFILESSLKIFLSVEVAALIYLLYERFVLRSSFKFSLKTGFKASTALFFLPVVAFVFSAIMLMLIVGGSSINPLFSDWDSLSFTNWLSVTASVLLSTFLPGIFILGSFINKEESFSKASFIALVALVSVFFSSIMTFVTFMAGYSLANIPLFMIATNAFLAVIYSFRINAKKEIFRQAKARVLDLNKLSILLVLILMVSTAIFITFFTANSFLKGDMWREFAIASKFSNMTPEMMKSTYGSPMWSIYWPQFYLTTLFSISNFPLINAYILLAFLNVLSVVAFYCLAKKFFKNSDSTVISTVIWSIFSGFGWIYVLSSPSWLGPVSNRLDVLGGGDLAVPWSISKPFGLWANDISVERSLAFISLLVLISILLSKKLSVKSVCLSTAFLVAFSYLFHVYEAGVFVLVIWPIIAWFSKSRPIRDKVLISASVVAGLAIVYLLDFLSIYHYYSETYLSYFLAFAVLTTIIVSMRSRILKVWQALHVSFADKFSSLATIFLVIAYFVGVISYFFSNFQYTGDMMLARVVPWYLYPLKLGVAGFIAVLGIGLLVQNKKRLPSKVKFSVIMVLALIFFGMLVSYAKTSVFYLPYEEMRVVDVLFPFLALTTGWVLSKFFFNLFRLQFRQNKLLTKIFGGTLIAVVLISGSLAALLSPEVWSLTTGPWGGSQAIPDGYTNALNYLRINGDPNTTIATVPGSADADLVSLAGLPTLAGVGPSMNQQFFEASGPNTFFGIAQTWNVKYLYMSDNGFLRLQKYYNNSYLYKQAIFQLPICFSASGNSIYKLVVPSQNLSSGYGITSQNLTITGLTTMVGSFSLPNHPLLSNGSHVGLLDLRQAQKVTVDNVPVQSFSLPNATIFVDSIKPSVTATVETNGVIIMAMPSEGSVYLFIERYNYTVNNPNNNSTRIRVMDQKGIFHNVTYVGVIKFVSVTSTYPLIFGKLPLSVQTFGTTLMGTPLFYLTDELQSSINQFGGVYKSRVVNGELAFRITGADHDTVFLDHFLLGNGSTTNANSVVGQKQNWPGFLSVETPQIPLNQLIAFSIAFGLILLVTVALFTYSKRHHNVQRQK